MNELKACPFCGGEAVCRDDVVTDHNMDRLWSVHCRHCNVGTYGDANVEDAIAAWNRHAEPAGAGWVKCEERVPESDGKYLCYVGSPHYQFTELLWFSKSSENEYGEAVKNAFWRDDSEWGDYQVDSVTHWLQLPEPPERSDGDV